MRTNLKQGRIADPIHGQVEFTWIERTIFEHRVAQRLRYISQTGLLHLVYPEARTSRFSHSLGSMHLASEFFAACVRNSEDKVKVVLGAALESAIRKINPRVEVATENAELLKDQPLLAHHYAPPEQRHWFLLAEQGLRLAALFHDLGHLPFSHDFENALERYWAGLSPVDREASPLRDLLEEERGGPKIHERLGHAASSLLFVDIYGTVKDKIPADTASTCFDLAHGILTAERSKDRPEASLYWLHSLIDGEVDVDRCDYILRDGRNYGFKFVGFDLKRLTDNLTVVMPNAEEQGIKEVFLLAVKPHGISEVESFLLSRYRSYEYGVRHHKVAQIGAALIHSIARTLADTQDARVKSLLSDIGTIINRRGDIPHPEANELLTRFADYDDSWWMSVMRDRLQNTPDPWLEVVCWRKSGPKSLWKWRGEFPAQIDTWNQALANMHHDRFAEFEGDWSKAIFKLEQRGVLVTWHHFTPWKSVSASGGAIGPRSSLMVYQENGTLKSVSELSPLVHSLLDAWAEDIQVQAFATPENIPESNNRAAFAKEVLEALPVPIAPVPTTQGE